MRGAGGATSIARDLRGEARLVQVPERARRRVGLRIGEPVEAGRGRLMRRAARRGRGAPAPERGAAPAAAPADSRAAEHGERRTARGRRCGRRAGRSSHRPNHDAARKSAEPSAPRRSAARSRSHSSARPARRVRRRAERARPRRMRRRARRRPSMHPSRRRSAAVRALLSRPDRRVLAAWRAHRRSCDTAGGVGAVAGHSKPHANQGGILSRPIKSS